MPNIAFRKIQIVLLIVSGKLGVFLNARNGLAVLDNYIVSNTYNPGKKYFINSFSDRSGRYGFIVLGPFQLELNL